MAPKRSKTCYFETDGNHTDLRGTSIRKKNQCAGIHTTGVAHFFGHLGTSKWVPSCSRTWQWSIHENQIHENQGCIDDFPSYKPPFSSRIYHIFNHFPMICTIFPSTPQFSSRISPIYKPPISWGFPLAFPNFAGAMAPRGPGMSGAVRSSGARSTSCDAISWWMSRWRFLRQFFLEICWVETRPGNSWQFATLKPWPIEIVDLPCYKMGGFSSSLCKRLPEGMSWNIWFFNAWFICF